MSSSSSTMRSLSNLERSRVPSPEPEADIGDMTLEAKEHPQSRPFWQKWTIVLVISSASLCAAWASSIAAFTESAMAAEFHVSREATILGISLFIGGLGWGPLLVGPLSELYGRAVIYRVSYTLFVLLNLPVVFASNLGVFLAFRLLTGLSASAFLAVAGGTTSDLFDDDHVGNPMTVTTLAPFLGPVLGPLVSGFINQHLYWRWTYRILICWAFIEMILLYVLVPETYVPVLISWKAQRLRRQLHPIKEKIHAARYIVEHTKHMHGTLARRILVSCRTPFQLMLHDRMALLLNIWTAFILGILYLAFQAYPIIFMDGHGFSMQDTGLAFIGIGVGMIGAAGTQPFWNRMHKRIGQKYGGHPPPEERLLMAQVGAVLVSVGLFWLAFTTYPSVHWVVPILASVPFGAGIYFVFDATFTYLVSAYRPIAASALAANSASRTLFAAAFPLFAPAMYARLGTVGATALLAGLAAVMAPLPFIFYRIGGRLRQSSRYAHK